MLDSATLCYSTATLSRKNQKAAKTRKQESKKDPACTQEAGKKEQVPRQDSTTLARES
jgi:hypothetical protein